MTFPEILESLDVHYITEGHHHCTTGYIQLDCPFCSPGHGTYRLGYNLEKGFLNCWTCGSHRIVDALVELAGISWSDAKSQLKKLDAIYRDRAERPTGKLVMPTDVGPMRQVHCNYLSERGFDPLELATRWGIQGIGQLGGRLAWRLFIPLVHQGEVISWTTRSIRDRGIRYVSASPEQEKYPHRHHLFGEDFCRHTCIVCEGPFDAMRIGPGAVATFGTNYTTNQLYRMIRFPKRVICFDAEIVAQKQAVKICHFFSGLPGETYNVVLDGKDPGEASESELRQLRKFLR